MFTEKAYNYFNKILKDSDKNYLEIGVFNGDSISNLGKNHPNKKIYGIDPFIEDGNTTWYTNTQKGQILLNQKDSTLKNIFSLNNVILFEMTSIEFYNKLTPELIDEMNIGFILIDGSHHYEDVKNDIELSINILKDDGIILFDDNNITDVKKALDEFKINYSTIISEEINVYEYYSTFKIKKN